ncbi:MAG TPA: Na/Pi symporter [Paenalcaligenes sp.]|nr:Na/Pi symporter [Paenalcaligenes sp.]
MFEVLFPLIGGVGLFLIGMMLLSRGLVAFAGQSLKSGLVRFTGTPWRAFGSGAVLTAMMQSSTATTITLIGFVSAGLIPFVQAIGVVIGASLGNTAASWIVSGLALKVNLSFYTLPLIGIGALLQLLGRGRWADLGLSLSGFGILFLGLRTLQLSMTDGADMFNLAALPVGGIGAHLFIMLLGLLLSTLLQSSAAAIATTLTAFDAGAINLEQGAAVVVGAAIGTTLTSALITIGATTAAKRTALAYILFNFITGLIAILLMPLFLYVVNQSVLLIGIQPSAIVLAAFHTFFIMVGALLFLPFTRQFARLVERLLPEKESFKMQHLDDSLLGMPDIALEASQRSLEHVAQELFEKHKQALERDNLSGPMDFFHHIQNSLEELFSFISRNQVEAGDERLSQQRIAQLHAVDHLLRLNTRTLGVFEHQDAVDPGALSLTADYTLPQIDQALGYNKETSDEAWVEGIKENAGKIRELTVDSRRELLKHPDRVSTTGSILPKTETLRWLERSSHHIWRICNYLVVGRGSHE